MRPEDVARLDLEPVKLPTDVPIEIWLEIGSQIDDLDTWLAFQLVSGTIYDHICLAGLKKKMREKLMKQFNKRWRYLSQLTSLPWNGYLEEWGDSMGKGCAYPPFLTTEYIWHNEIKDELKQNTDYPPKDDYFLVLAEQYDPL